MGTKMMTTYVILGAPCVLRFGWILYTLKLYLPKSGCTRGSQHCTRK